MPKSLFSYLPFGKCWECLISSFLSFLALCPCSFKLAPQGFVPSSSSRNSSVVSSQLWNHKSKLAAFHQYGNKGPHLFFLLISFRNMVLNLLVSSQTHHSFSYNEDLCHENTEETRNKAATVWCDTWTERRGLYREVWELGKLRKVNVHEL